MKASAGIASVGLGVGDPLSAYRILRGIIDVECILFPGMSGIQGQIASFCQLRPKNLIILCPFHVVCSCFVQYCYPGASSDKDDSSEDLATVEDFERDGIAIFRWCLWCCSLKDGSRCRRRRRGRR